MASSIAAESQKRDAVYECDSLFNTRLPLNYPKNVRRSYLAHMNCADYLQQKRMRKEKMSTVMWKCALIVSKQYF